MDFYRSSLKALFCVIALSGCSGRQGFEEITLQRESDFDFCPNYIVSIYPDGKVQYEGINHVATAGQKTRTISPESISAINKSLGAFNYQSLRDNYSDEKHGCKESMADLGWITITVKKGKSLKKISLYQGCEGLSEKKRIEDFADTVDRISGVKEWINGSAP